MDGYEESQLTLEKSYVDKIILIEKVIQRSEWCLCYNMYDCNCRPIIRSNYCFNCGYYKCTKKRFSKRRNGLFIWNSGGSLARSNSLQRKSDATAITRKEIANRRLCDCCLGDCRLGPRSRDRFNIFDWPDWPHDRVMFICLSNLVFQFFRCQFFSVSRSFSPSGSVIKIF
ncbi:unnamed protein product [Rhizophagus irregularis]|nr:unnamed protein product [Rhizophagus irregularis]